MKPLVASVHTQALVKLFQVAPLPTGQAQLVNGDTEVDPVPQATHGVKPSVFVGE